MQDAAFYPRAKNRIEIYFSYMVLPVSNVLIKVWWKKWIRD